MAEGEQHGVEWWEIPGPEGRTLFTPDCQDPIEEVEVARDLGVMLDNSMSFRTQRSWAWAKTLQKVGWVLRSFRTRDLGTLRSLWHSLVQPHMDYASQLWAPVGSRGALEAQEAPLRAFSRRIRSLSHLPYWERLARGGFMSCDRCQERYRIIYAWKVMHNLVPNCGLSWDSTTESRRGRTMAVPPLVGARAAVRSLREASFQVEGPCLFNALPRALRNLSVTLPTFKAHLDIFLGNVCDQPVTSGGPSPGALDRLGRPSNLIKAWARSMGSSDWDSLCHTSMADKSQSSVTCHDMTMGH